MDDILQKIIETTSKYNVDKVVLFGSRARGDNSLHSDYDIAIYGKYFSALDKARLCSEVEEIETLKKIDIVFVDPNVADGLLESIKKDGVTIYG